MVTLAMHIDFFATLVDQQAVVLKPTMLPYFLLRSAQTNRSAAVTHLGVTKVLGSVRGRTQTFCQPSGRTFCCLFRKYTYFLYKWTEKAAFQVL